MEAGKAVDDRPNLIFDIVAPDGSIIKPKRQWYWQKQRVDDAIASNEIEFVKNRHGEWTVHSKQYLKNKDGSIRKGKAFSMIDDIYSQHGTNEILDLFGNAKIFPYPKPTLLIEKLLQIGLEDNRENIVFDFFAGSGSTAQALMMQNASKETKNKYILVQLPEPCDEKSEAYKAGYPTIADISKERIRRAGKKIKKENPIGTQDLDVGFRVLKLDSSNMADVYYEPDSTQQNLISMMADNIKEDRTTEDLLFQVLLDWGVELTLPITSETIVGKEVFFVDENALVACFDKTGGITEELVRELAKRNPLRVVFRDAGFTDDSIKMNVEQFFKAMSPDTEVKTI